MFNLEYAQIIKIRTSVSSETSKPIFEACNTGQVSASSWLQTVITLFPAGETKNFFSLEVIIKGTYFGRILELNSSTVLSFRSIDLCNHCRSKALATCYLVAYSVQNL